MKHNATWSGQGRPRRLAVPLAGVIGLILGARVEGGPPATRPDRLDEQARSNLAEIAKRMNRRRWGPAVIETYDQPGPEKAWSATGANIQVKNGCLVLAPPAAQAGFFYAHRPLPEALRNADGLRVEIRVAANPVGAIVNLGLFVSDKDSQPMQWDCYYMFASGGQGRIQRLQATGGLRTSAVADDQIALNKPMNVRLEIIDRLFAGYRGTRPPIRYESPAPLKLTEEVVIGLSGQCKELRLSRLVLRPLETAAKPGDAAELWKQAGFATHDELTAYLRAVVVPGLGDPVYARRRASAELLASLLPLSRPALEAELKKSARLHPEMKLQVEALLDSGPMLLVEPLPEDSPAATQPAGEQAG